MLKSGKVHPPNRVGSVPKEQIHQRMTRVEERAVRDGGFLSEGTAGLGTDGAARVAKRRRNSGYCPLCLVMYAFPSSTRRMISSGSLEEPIVLTTQ